ncbi:MAG: hypothetical protein SWH54_20095 [Thermodesulfobacteriota bacterium]|nr:hypothetical protein [Thermodesulfobacteriota bacterium]
MTKTIGSITFIYLIILVTGCHFAGVSEHSPINAQTLAGNWRSTIITYPNDPIFKNHPPITKPGSVVLLFQHNGHFIFSWEDTHVSGTYHVNGQHLVFTSPKEKEAIQCLVEFKESCLTIKMPDGFKFSFVKTNSAPD